MDKATVIGPFLGIGAILGGQVLEGGHVGSIMQATAAIIVLGGTFGAVFVSFPFQDVLKTFKEITRILKEPPHDPYHMIDQISGYANKARKEGILSLERDVKDIDDPFLKKALTMAVDGVEPDPEGRLQNRRVDFVVLSQKKMELEPSKSEMTESKEAI